MANITRAFGAWNSFTTSWTAATTNPAIGNGTIASSYSQIGKIVNFRIVLTAGSTTTFGTGFYGFTVPVTAAAAAAGSYTTIGNTLALDFSSTLVYEATTCLATTTSLIVRYQTAGLLAPTAPVTFAVSDIIVINGTYQAA